MLQTTNTDAEPLTKKEALNRNIMLSCLFLGGVIGAGGAIMSNGEPFDLFGDSPVPVTAAIIFALLWGIVVPVIAIFWHRRAVDEQEAHAYKEGAFYALYFYAIIWPIWSILWRGGLLPEPGDGEIYFATLTIWLVIWGWKKYA